MKAWVGRHKRGLAVVAATAGVLLLLALTLFWARVPLLRGVGSYLGVADAPVRGDVLVLFNGDADSRAIHAANLYDRALAPRIVLSQAEQSPSVERGIRPGETELSLQLLEHAGVPPEAVTVISRDDVGSTWDEARALTEWLRTQAVERVLVVTSRLHARRTRWALKRAFRSLEDPPRIVMLPAEHWDFDAETWWRSERGVVFVFTELAKLFYYWCNY